MWNGVERLERKKKRWDSGTVNLKVNECNGLDCPTPFGTVGQQRNRYSESHHKETQISGTLNPNIL